MTNSTHKVSFRCEINPLEFQKNEWLKENRGVCFELIADILERNDELAGFEHPDQEKYPGQRMIVVEIKNYAYLVPCVEDDTEVFLKTIIPSRKMTAKYLR